MFLFFYEEAHVDLPFRQIYGNERKTCEKDERRENGRGNLRLSVHVLFFVIKHMQQESAFFE